MVPKKIAWFGTEISPQLPESEECRDCREGGEGPQGRRSFLSCQAWFLDFCSIRVWAFCTVGSLAVMSQASPHFTQENPK